MDGTKVMDAGFKAEIDAIIKAHGNGGRNRTWGRMTLFWSMVGQALRAGGRMRLPSDVRFGNPCGSHRSISSGFPEQLENA